MTGPDRTVRQALAYADRGWPVFPCRPGSKVPATPHGLRDATTDPDRIRAWWKRTPDANLAIATGAPGPDVLDVDQHGPAGNGFDSARRIRRAGLLTGAFALVGTPNGGLHGYFPGTAQRTARLPLHHLDLRAAGGCVLAPPSTVRGRPYRLIGTTGAPPAALDWPAITRLLEPVRLALPDSHREAMPGDPGRLAAWVERLPEGNRNSGLFWAACRLAEAGHHSALDDLGAAAARTGLPEREIAATLSSARRAARPAPEPTA